MEYNVVFTDYTIFFPRNYRREVTENLRNFRGAIYFLMKLSYIENLRNWKTMERIF